jgi:hypothetical protein
MSAGDRQDRLREFAEAAAAASAIERRNRPTALVGISILVLAAGLLFALWQVNRQMGSRNRLRTAEAQFVGVQERAIQARGLLENPQREALEEKYQPETQLRTKLQRAGTDLGLDRLNFGNLRDERFEADSPLVRKVLDVTITGVLPEQGLEWIDRVRADVPGLEVIGLELRPDASGWTFRVRVARWETDR